MKEFTGTSFYEYLTENKLMGSRCEACGELYVPPRPLCPSCHGDAMTWEEMSGAGQLVAFTTVHIAPTAMIEAGYGRDNPYCVGIVELAEGPAISAQIVGVDTANPTGIAVGTRLRATYVERGDRSFLGFEPAA
jgi:hypothetical protein